MQEREIRVKIETSHDGEYCGADCPLKLYNLDSGICVLTHYNLRYNRLKLAHKRTDSCKAAEVKG